MRRILKAIPTLLAFLLLINGSSLAAQFKVTRVSDGDTVKAEGCSIVIMVKQAGTDAPETSRKMQEPGQPYSQQAKKLLAGLILNKTVDIQGQELDRYNRLLGVIYLDGKNINLEMVRAGPAEVYRGKPARGLDLKPFWEAKKEAREAKPACLL